MANVFDGLKKLEDKDIRYEIAVLEEINLINYAKQIGQVIEESSLKITNFLFALFGKKACREPEFQSIKVKIDKRYDELQKYDREKLDKILKDNIIKKLNKIGENITSNSSLDKISVAILKNAIKIFKDRTLDELSPSEKADKICKDYNKRFLNGSLDNFFYCKTKDNIIYELLAHIVWKSGLGLCKNFTPSINELPSFCEGNKYTEMQKESDIILSLVYENNIIKDEINDLNSKMYSCKVKYHNCNDAINDLNEKIIDLNMKSFLFQQEKEDNKKNLLELQEQITYNNKILSEKKANLNKSNKLINDKVKVYANSLEKRWSKTYNSIMFMPEVYKYVILNFEYKEFFSIESKLLELNNVDDPYALSCNRIYNLNEGCDYIKFVTPYGLHGNIYYIILCDNSDNKKILITSIEKYETKQCKISS